MPPTNQLTLPLDAPPVTGEMPLIPARMVNEFVYCPRLAYLIQYADNREWLEDPAAPAIIVGTVDMIGSCSYQFGYLLEMIHLTENPKLAMFHGQSDKRVADGTEGTGKGTPRRYQHHGTC